MRRLLAILALLAASPTPGAHPPPAVEAARMSADVRVLASPAFGGRAPGTPGEDRTVAWLIDRLQAMGLQPGGPDGRWTQDVPLIRTRLRPGAVRAGAAPWTQGREVYLSTVRDASRVALNDLPMTFVGYGVHAPERGWDDFKGVDLRGKAAVFLVNDPDFAAAAGEPVAGRFGGRRMTYEGRWTYKFEEAARRGAAAALIVHDTPGAGYGWPTVIAPGGENYDVVRAPGDTRVALQGWIEGGAAAALFRAAGLDLAAERIRARSPGFRPVELKGQLFSADLPVGVERKVSRNVLARLRGTTHAEEVVMYGAHWDAYGVGAPDPQGRTLRPGANDDALGVAAALEVARVLSQHRERRRSVVFAFWTGEERGLLGSEYYAQHPVYPLATTVANLTFDILNTAGPSRDAVLVGPGRTTLEDGFAAAMRDLGATVTPEALPERGLYYRADHFSLARRGVPSLLLMAIGGAPDLQAGGRAAGQAWLDGYMRCYHQPCDEWSPAWNLDGARRDVQAFADLGRSLVARRDWPAWRAGGEFRAIRARTAAARR